MNFTTETMLGLADPESAVELIDTVTAEALIRATFDLARVDVQSVDAVAVRSSDLASMSPDMWDVQMMLAPYDAGTRFEVNGGLRSQNPTPGFDADLRIAVATSTRLSSASVTDVRSQPLDDVFEVAAVDARIVADDGALPADAAALEEQRREALLALLLDDFELPEDWDQADFMARASAEPFTQFIGSYQPPAYPSRLSLDIEIDPDVDARTLDFALDVGVFVVDAPLDDLTGLISRIRAVRGPAARTASQPHPPEGVTVVQQVPVLVICPTATFSDTELPTEGGTMPGNNAAARAARRTELNRRLRTSGIVFAST